MISIRDDILKPMKDVFESFYTSVPFIFYRSYNAGKRPEMPYSSLEVLNIIPNSRNKTNMEYRESDDQWIYKIYTELDMTIRIQFYGVNAFGNAIQLDTLSERYDFQDAMLQIYLSMYNVNTLQNSNTILGKDFEERAIVDVGFRTVEVNEYVHDWFDTIEDTTLTIKDEEQNIKKQITF